MIAIMVPFIQGIAFNTIRQTHINIWSVCTFTNAILNDYDDYTGEQLRTTTPSSHFDLKET